MFKGAEQQTLIGKITSYSALKPRKRATKWTVKEHKEGKINDSDKLKRYRIEM